MLIARIARWTLVRMSKAREFTGQLQPNLIKSLGMQAAQLIEMGKERLAAIHHLQKQKVGDLGDAATAGL